MEDGKVNLLWMSNYRHVGHDTIPVNWHCQHTDQLEVSWDGIQLLSRIWSRSNYDEFGAAVSWIHGIHDRVVVEGEMNNWNHCSAYWRSLNRYSAPHTAVTDVMFPLTTMLYSFNTNAIAALSMSLITTAYSQHIPYCTFMWAHLIHAFLTKII